LERRWEVARQKAYLSWLVEVKTSKRRRIKA
jgi:hypothetical protein